MPAVNSQLAMIDDIIIDCLLSDEHSFESDVSDYPTESGDDITDNVRPKPIVVTMECLISNTPLEPIRSQRDLTVPPADQVYVRLQQIRNTRKQITIKTSLDTYERMVMKNLTINRSASVGDALQFTASFQQIETATNIRNIRVAIPGAKAPKTTNKPPKDAADDLTQCRIVDKKTKQWFDPDINQWRYAALYLKKKGTWELYKLQAEGPEDPFDSTRFDGKHPINNQIALVKREYVIKG